MFWYFYYSNFYLDRLSWNDYFHLMCIFCGAPSELIIKFLIHSSGTAKGLYRITLDDVKELVKLTGIIDSDENEWNKKAEKLKPDRCGLVTIHNIICFLSRNPSYIRILYIFQRKLCEISIGKINWKNAKERRTQQMKVWKEEDKNPRKKTKNIFVRSIQKIFSHENKNSEYQLIKGEENELIDSIVQFYRLRYCPTASPEISAEPPRIKELKKIGSTYTIPCRSERPSLDPLSNLDCTFDAVEVISIEERRRIKSESYYKARNHSRLSPLAAHHTSRSVPPNIDIMNSTTDHFQLLSEPMPPGEIQFYSDDDNK